MRNYLLQLKPFLLCLFSIIHFSFSGDFVAPVFNSSSIINNTTGVQFTLRVNVDQISTVYYVVNTTDTNPTTTEIKAGQIGGGGAAPISGSFLVTAASNIDELISGLTAGTSYFVNFFAENGDDEQSSVQEINATATDSTPPVINSSSIINITDVQFTLRTNISENATVYYVVTSSGTAPSSAQIEAGDDENDDAALFSGSALATGGINLDQIISGLTPTTGYHIHFFAKDASGNESAVSSRNASTVVGMPTSGSFTSTTCVDNGTVTFSAPSSGLGFTYLVFVKPSSAITIGSPSQDPTTYGAPTTDLSNTTPAYENDANARLVYRGNSVPASINLTGLASNAGWTTFHVAIFNVKDNTTYSAPLTFSGSRAASSTIGTISNYAASPLNQSAQLTFDFPNTCFDQVMIVARSGSAPTTTTPVGTSFTADADFTGGGTALNSGKVVYYSAGTPGANETFNVTGLTNGTTYHFRYFVRKGLVWFVGTSISVTPDVAPAITNLNPADNSTLMSLSFTNAVITFDVNVEAGSGGGSSGDNRRSARLYRASDDFLVEEVDRSLINFSGQTATIPFNETLTDNTSYYIQIGANTIRKSPGGIAFPGISDKTTWNFNVITFQVSVGPNVSICAGENVTIYGSASGGTGFYQYSWTGPGGFTSSSPNPTVTPPLIAGDYQYTLTVTDTRTPTPESDTKSVIVTVKQAPSSIDFTASGTDTNVRTLFDTQENPYELAAIGDPEGGVLAFSGIGVSLFPNSKYYFQPQVVGTNNNPITITCTYTLNGCSISTDLEVSVFNSNAIVNGLQSQYCVNDGLTVTLSHNPATIPAGTTYTGMRLYRWEGSGQLGYVDISDPVNAPFILVDQGTNPKTYRLNTTLAGAGSYFLDVFVNDGISEYFVVYGRFTISANPNAPTFETIRPYCVSDVIANERVTVLAPGSSLITWYNNPAPSSPIADILDSYKPTFDELGLEESFNGVFTKYATQTDFRGCESPVGTVSITVNPNPSPPSISNPSPICSGDAFSNLVAGGGGDTYRWYGTLGPNTPDFNTIYTPSGNIANPSELLIPNTVVSTTSFQRYVSRFVTGCESSVAGVDVVVREKPIAPLAASPTYCLNETISVYEVTTSSPAATVRWFLNSNLSGEITSIIDSENATAEELGISSTSAGNYSRYVTQTINFCQSDSRLVTTTINPLPAVNFSPDIVNICKSDDPIKLDATPRGVGGSWSGSAAPGLSNIDLPNGQALLDPSSAIFSPGQNYLLQYTYIDGSTNCSNSVSKNFSMYPSINPSLAIGDICDNSFVSISNTSQIIPNGAASTIETTGWNFDDGDLISEGSGALPVPLHGGRTTGLYFDLEHKYSGVGSKTIRYSMTTSDGCLVNAQQTIFVNPVPNINFTWTNACQSSPTIFNASTTPNIDASIEHYHWNFTKTSQITTETILGANGQTPSVQYGSSGRDSVQLIVETFANCRDTIQKPIFIVPAFDAINSTNSYDQNFNTGADGWIDGGSNSSWQFGLPAGSVISRDSSLTGSGKAWVTNLAGLYNPLEKSWVLSRCYNFETSKPVLAMDIWADTPGGIDGAVLQYNLSGNILNDNDWFVIGTVNSGINWYQQQGIASKPGNQNQFDYGWSGNQEDGRYKSWRHVVHKLDELSGASGVVFRIAFSSTSTGTREGFAFDNIFIGERNRNVLVENFTNTAASDAATHNQLFNTFPSGGSSEIIKMQFHTNFPGVDPQNQLLPAINNARTAFYGITTSPTLRIDGLFNPSGSVAQWAEGLYDNRVLEPSPIRININNPVKDGNIVRISASITNTTSSPLSLQGTNAFIAIVEKDVSPHTNVVRQLLPNAAGIQLNQTLNPGEVLQLPEVVWGNRNLTSISPGNSAVIVFVQSISASNQQVLQAQIYNNPVEPDITTSIEDPAFFDKISIYPNPANREVNVVLPERTLTPIALNLMDAHGRTVNTNGFATGEQQKTIDTSELAAGLYIIQLNTSQGVVRKKVMVVHER